MNVWKNTCCPQCGAVNVLGALMCHACGKTLRRAGFGARPMDDDDDEPPRKPAKKPARPIDDDEDEEERRPAKKVSRRDDYDEDEEDRRPVKKKRRRRDEEEEEESIRDNAVLNMFLPVGVSIWAMGSFLLGIFGLLGAPVSAGLAGATGNKWVGIGLGAIALIMSVLAIPLGGLSFILRSKKVTYGHVTGYIRAIIGILCGLLGTIAGAVAIWWAAATPLR